MRIGSCGRKFAALLLASAMLAGGCGSGQGISLGTDEAGNGGQGVEMGRFVEEYSKSNTELGRCTALTRLEDGRLAVFSYNDGPFVSADEGRTWEPWQTEWYSQNCDYIGYRCAAIAPDGTMFVGYLDYSAEAENMEQAPSEGAEDMEQAPSAEEGPDGVLPEEETDPEAAQEDIMAIWMDYQVISPDGDSRRLEVEPLNGRNGNGIMLECWYAPDKGLYVADGEHLYELSVEDESLTLLFEEEADVGQLCFPDGDIMLASTTEGVFVYDRKNGALKDGDEVLDAFVKQQTAGRKGVIKYTDDSYSVCLAAGEGKNLYLVCEDGIYSHVLGGGTMEKLLEGSLCTLGDPSQGIYGLMAFAEHRLFALYRDASGIYSYDENMPTLPEKELKVYSLVKDDVVQQAAVLFQKAHPDVYVNYEVGRDESSGQTKEDVIKTLNTEILAGNGPDVLILDGFPMDAYVEKGLLEELSDVAERAQSKEALFDNLVNAFRQDGKLYAIPMRCKIPVMIGPCRELENVTDLDGLATAAENLRKNQAKGSVTGTYSKELTLRLLAQSCAPAWENEDGSVNLEAVKEFYEQARRFFEAEDAGITQEERDSWDEVYYTSPDGTLQDEPWMLIDNNAYQSLLQENRMGMGYASDMWALEIMFSVRRQGKELECTVQKGQAERVFYPCTIAGISASAKETELAEQFVGLMLSKDSARASGFSVNREALQEEVDLNNDGDGGVLGAMAVMDESGNMQEMTVYQLRQDEVEWLYETLESAETPYLQNETLETAVLEVGEKLLDGKLEPDAALKEVESRVKLSMAE